MTTTNTYKDIATSLVTSGYKWLTSTLLAAQKKFNVRPYFTVQIIDDTIAPNAQLFSGGAAQGGRGSMVTAPDGKVFAVGVESSALKVWRSSDLHGDSGVFADSVTLSTSGENFDSTDNNYSITCSDWYKGSYRLVVWYFANFANDGTNLTIKAQYSDDGGITWTKIGFFPSSFPNNNYGNISIAGMTPFLDDTGAMKIGAFYIKNSTDIYYIYGDSNGYTSDHEWTDNVDSGDWNLHSLGAFRLNGVQYCVFSGYRDVIDSAGVNKNYSLWVTSILDYDVNNAIILWSAPTPIMPVGSASSTNLNSFTLPNASIINDLVYVTFNAVTVDSLAQTSQGSTAQVVTTHTNHQMIVSDDGKSFSYPTVLAGTDGTEFSNGSYASFVPQGGYIYLGGDTYLWEMIQNNVVADVSTDVVGYQIQEAAGQPASLNLQIANANNKWVGSLPTGQGAAAIKKNKKIVVWQGYYNADGTPESVPRSVFYIDDIEQTVTGTENNVTLVCRDFYKKLKTTITKYSYQFNGPTLFSDIFDGTFASSYNQIHGQWSFIATTNPTELELSSVSGADNVITLGTTNGASYGAHYRLFFRTPATIPSGTHVHFYPLYIDSDNWLRLDLDAYGGTAWKVTKNVEGTQSDLDSGTLPFTLGSSYFGVIIKRYSYNKFQFIVMNTVNSGNATGNDLAFYNPSTTTYVCMNNGTGEYDMTGVFSSQYTVGMGASDSDQLNGFRFFAYTQWNNPNNLGVVLRSMARIASIFAFKISYTWQELMYGNNFDEGTVSNRKLTLPASTTALSTANTDFSNGEISFEAKVTVPDYSTNVGFSFLFRHVKNGTNGSPEHYKFHMMLHESGFIGAPISCRFERYVAGLTPTLYYFYNSPFDVEDNPYTGSDNEGSLNIDFTKWHTYRIFMIDGWMYAFCDDEMVAAWNDNNTLINYLTSGSWGFETDANTKLEVRNINAPNFWKPVESFSFNPGDDAESAIESLTQQLRAFFFSDLFGRFRTKFLGSTDASTYSYDAQLFQQKVDDSDKEWISQVTVYGNGVIATSRNNAIMPGVPTREEVIVDYTITTQQDAQTRADNELINANQYRNQYTPKQVVNVGSEIFDVITIINTGNNTSGVDDSTRVYAQTFAQGGGNNNSDYSLEIETGNL